MDKCYESVKIFIRNHLNQALEQLEGCFDPRDLHTRFHAIVNTIKRNANNSDYLSILHIEQLTISDNQWNKMLKEFETEFQTTADIGLLIKDDNSSAADRGWWSKKLKKIPRKIDRWGAFREYIENGGIPRSVLDTLDKDTDNILDQLGNPAGDYSSFDVRGMVVGSVQSGKTLSYSGLICKASDAGYRLIIIIAGGLNNLRNQTQERINSYFVGRHDGHPIGVGKKNNNEVISLTSAKRDFLASDANRNSDGISIDKLKDGVTVIAVIKKNTTTLKSLIKWLKSSHAENYKHAMMLIDDESDYASINTNDKDNDPTVINKHIRKLLGLFEKSSYVAYTATPYANIFIDHLAKDDEVGSDLFPKDFIYVLEPPSSYFGVDKMFGLSDFGSESNYVRLINDCEVILPIGHKKDHHIKAIPNSLKEAVCKFVFNVSARNLLGQDSHNSMLVHISRFTNIHKQVAVLLREYLCDSISLDLKYEGYKSREDQNSYICNRLKFEYDNLIAKEMDIVNFSYEQLVRSATDLCLEGKIEVCEEHLSSSRRVDYSHSKSNFIVVGGSSLSRGFTLEGLSVSYFIRNTNFYDTLMQMGRWYGYRNGYDFLCCLYTVPEVQEKFAIIHDATEDLLSDLRRMSDENLTPKEFGLKVKRHPDSALQVTSRGKSRGAEDIPIEMTLSGTHLQAVRLVCDKQINRQNVELIRAFINDLHSRGAKFELDHGIGGDHLLVRDIPKDVAINLINHFVLDPKDEHAIASRFPKKFIEEHLQDCATGVDIAIYSGSSKPYAINNSLSINLLERQFNSRAGFAFANKSSISTEGYELIALSTDDAAEVKKLEKKRLEARKRMQRPLLMLFFIQPTAKTDADADVFSRVYHDDPLVSLGISFPFVETAKHIKLNVKVNRVYLETRGLIEYEE